MRCGEPWLGVVRFLLAARGGVVSLVQIARFRTLEIVMVEFRERPIGIFLA